MNSTTKNILKTIGKGVAVIVTPGSFIVLIIFLICFFYYRYKKAKAKKQELTGQPNGQVKEQQPNT